MTIPARQWRRAYRAIAAKPRTVPRTVGAIVLVAALSCDTDGPVAPAGGDGLIRGSVTSAKTSAGIPSLIVALTRDGRVVGATPTDSLGAFEFRGIARGSYVVRLTGLELAGVSERHTAFTPAEDTVAVDAAPVELFFAAVGLIPPRVVGDVSCGGVPVADVSVRVVGGSTDEVVTTNAQGRYGVTDLDEGYYAVIVVDGPCAVQPAFGTALLRPGQAAEVDFAG